MSEEPGVTLSSSPAPVLEERDRVFVPDPDRFLTTAKQLVADNYNEHHDEQETPPLDIEDIYIVWFAKVLDSWKAVVASTVARGLVWMVSYNGRKSEAYIEIYKKINNVKVTRGRS